MRGLLQLADPPTAPFASDNLMLLGAFEAMRDTGTRVPEDLSMVAFDDLEWTKLVTPPLSVVAQPVYEMGAEAARRLLERIGGTDDPSRETVLKTTYIDRESTSPRRQPPTRPFR